MIQRIQTIFLVAAAILMVLPVLLRSHFVTMETDAGSYQLTPEEVILAKDSVADHIMSAYPIAGGFVVSLFLSIYAIAQFKNRKFQLKLVRLAMLLQPVIIVLVLVYADKMTALDNAGTIHYSPILALPGVAMVLYLLAARGIKKDDELVRSADRLR